MANRYVQFTGGREIRCSDCKAGNIKIGAFPHNGIFGHMLLMFSEGIYFVPPLRSSNNDLDKFTYNLYQKIDYNIDKWFTQPHFDLYYYVPPGQIELVWKKKYSEPPEYFSQYYSAPSHMFHITESSPLHNTVVYGDTSVTLRAYQRLEEIELYNKLYSGVVGRKLKLGTNHVLVAGQGCSPSISSAITTPPFSLNSIARERELLADGMVLQRLSVTKLSAKNYEVGVRVASGDPDMFETNNYLNGTTPTNCKSGTASQFCAVSELVTTARIR